jgi:hypothetical protein
LIDYRQTEGAKISELRYGEDGVLSGTPREDGRSMLRHYRKKQEKRGGTIYRAPTMLGYIRDCEKWAKHGNLTLSPVRFRLARGEFIGCCGACHA